MSEPPLQPDHLTWAALLGRWVEFAKSALALPTDDPGRRMRESVPDIIMLQAVWFALKHMNDLASSERSLGLDRAEVLIEKHSASLEAIWQGEVMPNVLHDLMRDAVEQLRQAGS